MIERLKLPEGWLSLFLLFIMLTSAATSISAAAWTKGLENLMTAAVLSLITGLLLAKSRFPALIAHLFGLVYGLFSVSYLIGRMVDQPAWRERLIELGERTATWLTKATSGGTSRDSLMFVLLLTSLFWLLGHTAAWYTFRRPRLWRVLLPVGLTLLVNQYVYTDPRISTRSTTSLIPFIGIFLLAALLYTARTNIYMHELEWQSSQVNYSTEIRFEFVRAGAILSAVALLIMLAAPGARAASNIGSIWGGIEDLRSSVSKTVTRLFSSLDTYGRGIANPFPGQAVLGGPRDLGEEVLFDVQASKGRYWRANIYDRYTGDSWINSDNQRVVRPAGELVGLDSLLQRYEMTQTVTVYLPNTTQLFAAPEPVRVPLFSTRINASFNQGEMTPASAIYAQKPLKPGNTYQIISSVSTADPDTLRKTSRFYPDWITARYLQLPDTITDRTRALAEEITAEHETVFDKAQAIERYLRQNLNYNLDVPAPPEDQDFVDFVLFNLQEGYCDYYASSFVVLARAVGIPARIAYGYAQDEYDQEARAFRVRAKNGHSWPEIYFPSYGWIQFEPTVVIAPIDWPAPPSDSEDDTPSSNTGRSGDFFSPVDDRERLIPDEPDDFSGGMLDLPPVESSRGISPVFYVLAGLLIAAGLSAVVIFWNSEIRGLGGLNLVEQAYARLWRFAARLGVPNPPDQTPYERAEALTTLVPEGEAPIRYITDLYVVERFAMGNADCSEAEDKWSSLRPILWKSWLQKRLSRFQRQDRQRRWRDFYETN